MTIIPIEDQKYADSVIEKYPFIISDKISDKEYSLQCSYEGEIRMGPPYYSVEALRNGNKIWNSRTYGGELFNKNIISAKHHKLILVKWYSLDPNNEVVVKVDLETGKEKILTGEARYHYAGHFDSFDGIFYAMTGKDLICENFETQEKFFLNETLNKSIDNIISWGISPVRNTIIVVTSDETQNVILFNLKNKLIVSTATMENNLSPNGSINCFLDKENEKIIFEFNDYEKTDQGNISIQYYKSLIF
ncbi:hypothetical protein [uncultured Chryseobacterium sp.]|uniref:hypothetical protein n=1 Tax=uncultured Chryseobacterium sp. TaxID=259322 RepID=UPI0025DC664D|nr:hypothetical protein [uncultured Chryseobacterium sp.]